MSHQAHIDHLEQELQLAKRAATPVTVALVRATKDERVTKSSNGTTRRDCLGGVRDAHGGEPQQCTRRAAPVVEPPGLKPVSKEIGKVIKENEEERVTKLVGGTIRTDIKG